MQNQTYPHRVHFDVYLKPSHWTDLATLLKIKNEADSEIIFTNRLDTIVKSQHQVMVWVGETSQLVPWREVFNELNIDFVIDRNAEREELARVLADCQNLLVQKSKQRHSIEQIKNQNRELEELTKGLEVLVGKRTQSATDSKAEVEKRSAQLRELLRFVQAIAAANTPEEVLQTLRREIKSYHRLNEPALAFAMSSGERRLLYFRSGQIFEKRATQFWPQSLRLRKNDNADSLYLANEWGRPVSRVLAVPLIVRKGGPDQLYPTLFFEHQMKAHEVDSFLNFIGDRLQVVSVALDRLLLEFDLRAASFQWEHTFDGLEDPVAIVDVDRQMLRGNKAFGPQNEGVCHQVFSKSNSVCHGCPIQQALATGQPASGLVSRGASMYSVHSYPIFVDQHDHATTVVNHYLNVTEALALQEQMVQNEKMAALGHLAGHIAHELNNPLTGIRSLAQFWRQQTLHSQTSVSNDFKEIEAAAERSQTIITNLLQFAKAGTVERVELISLNEIVQKTLPLLKTALSQHQQTIEIPQANCWVRANPSLLQQVLFNIIKNGCQAIQGSGAISIRLESSQLKGQEAWAISVSDSGVGIPAQQLEQIFAPFYTTKEESQGTGLGLSLSRSIIRRFAGEIEVESKVGQGTTFRITLPKAEAP